MHVRWGPLAGSRHGCVSGRDPGQVSSRVTPGQCEVISQGRGMAVDQTRGCKPVAYIGLLSLAYAVFKRGGT